MAAPQLQRLRLLAAGHLQGPPQPGFHRLLLRYRLLQEQDALEARDFRFPVAFLVLLHQGVGLGQGLEAVCRVAQVARDVRQHGAKVWDIQRYPGGPPGGDPLAYPCHPRLALALHSQRPPTQARSHGHLGWKGLLGRERDGGLCLRMDGRHVPATLRDEGRLTPRKRQTIGMRQRVGQRQGLVEAGQASGWKSP